jgi:hypothetical protein
LLVPWATVTVSPAAADPEELETPMVTVKEPVVLLLITHIPATPEAVGVANELYGKRTVALDVNVPVRLNLMHWEVVAMFVVPELEADVLGAGITVMPPVTVRLVV